jgi:predicted O-methyltransferase YrrM
LIWTTGRSLAQWASGIVSRRRDDATISVRELLADARVPRSDWSISERLATELAAYLERVQPRRILEVGSGFSTAVLAAYAIRHDAEVVTLEHAYEYHELTRKGLATLALDAPVDLRLAPLREQKFAGHGPYRWYSTKLEDDFDFVFVDGPPKVMGRQGVFFAVEKHLRPGWRMWLDDGLRKHERRCIRLWRERFPGHFSETRLDIDGKGVFILSDARGERERAEEQAIAGRLGIGILANGDPDWWPRAKQNLGDRLLDSSYVVVTAQHSSLTPEPRRFINRRRLGDRRPLEQRIQWILHELAGRPNVRYVLFLDDRWSPSPLVENWLSRALDILEKEPKVEQVCLKHRIDATDEAARRGSRQPFTGTPSLLRANRLSVILQPEAAKSRRRQQTPSLRTIQLSPGVFRRDDRHGRPSRPT